MKPLRLSCILLSTILLVSLFSLLGEKSEASRPAWTLLLYGAVDNNADDPFVQFTDQVRRAIDDDPGIQVVLFIDRSNEHNKRPTYLGADFTGSRLYRIRKNSVERLSGGTYFPEITKDSDVNLNSADASNLQRFIAFGKANYPAERYGLLIYSHANGKVMCPDERAGSQMGITESTDKIGATERVDFLALELCNMGGLEIAYQWRPGNGGFEADVLLAIPNAGPPLDWDRAFRRIRSPNHAPVGGPALDPAKMTAVDFGKLVIEEGRLGRQASEKRGESGSKEAAGCYDLRKGEEVKKAVDALAVALANSDSKAALMEIRNASAENQLISYSGDGSYVDLYDLCRRITGNDRLSEPVRSAATRVMKSLPGFVVSSFGMSGYKQFEGGKNGVFIVLPSGRPNSWRYYRWYSPVKGDRATYGNWAFLRDGATAGNGVVDNWYELLESWFNMPAEPEALNMAEMKKELDTLQGEWMMVSREQGGEKTRAEVVKQFKLTITGDQWTVAQQGRPNSNMTLQVDPTKNPKTLDLIANGNKDNVLVGIYKLEGDTLTMCRTTQPGDLPRPREFKATPEEGTIIVWKRVKK